MSVAVYFGLANLRKHMILQELRISTRVVHQRFGGGACLSAQVGAEKPCLPHGLEELFAANQQGFDFCEW